MPSASLETDVAAEGRRSPFHPSVTVAVWTSGMLVAHHRHSDAQAHDRAPG